MTQYVVDASVVLNYLLAGERHIEASRFLTENTDLIAPPVFLTEVVGEIAATHNGGRISAEQAAEARHVLVNYLSVDIRPFPLGYETVPRLAELGANLALADASYVLLGETTGAPVITQDRRMVEAAVKVTPHEVRRPDER